MSKIVTVRQALQDVAEHPTMATDVLIQVPAYELVARALFEIANNPDEAVRGSMARANKARKMILDRLVGIRRAGSHPATRNGVEVEFVDLTGGELDESEAHAEGQATPANPALPKVRE